MASEDLLKKAVAAFNALSPEQQAEMLEEQRQSWVRGNVGLSRDDRDMTSPMMREVENRLAPMIKAVNSWADSKTTPAPAATDTGLETLSVEMLRDYAFMKSDPEGDYVTRSQAEELLAAERAESVRTAGIASEQMARAEKAEADNAALTARVREYETGLVDFHREMSALEAKLAAAEKVREAAIELDEAISDDFNIFGAQQKLRAALGGKPS